VGLNIDNATEGAPPVSPLEAIKNTYFNAFNLSGCISRSEYFYFILWAYLPMFVAILLADEGQNIWVGVSPFIVYFMGLNFLFTIPASVRRLHDIGKSGWWLVMSVFGVGFLVLLWWWSRPGIDPKINKFSGQHSQPKNPDNEKPGSWTE